MENHLGDTAPHVSDIFVYPLKSAQGIRQGQAEVTTKGLKHDRKFMLARGSDGRMITQRGGNGRLAVIKTRIEGDDLILSADGIQELTLSLTGNQDLRPLATRVHASDTTGLDQGDEKAQWFQEFLKDPTIRVVRAPDEPIRPVCSTSVGGNVYTDFADAYPILVATRASLEDLNRIITSKEGQPVPMDRFRPNIVLESTAAWQEDRTRFLQIFDDLRHIVLQLVKPCTRCEITTIDQGTGEKIDTEPLASMSKFRRVDHLRRRGLCEKISENENSKVIFGENAVVESGQGSTIYIGDFVQMIPR